MTLEMTVRFKIYDYEARNGERAKGVVMHPTDADTIVAAALEGGFFQPLSPLTYHGIKILPNADVPLGEVWLLVPR